LLGRDFIETKNTAFNLFFPESGPNILAESSQSIGIIMHFPGIGLPIKFHIRLTHASPIPNIRSISPSNKCSTARCDTVPFFQLFR